MSRKQSKRQTYSVVVEDTVKVKDNLDTSKNWFNGVKKFRMVKLIPPYNREGLE